MIRDDLALAVRQALADAEPARAAERHRVGAAQPARSRRLGHPGGAERWRKCVGGEPDGDRRARIVAALEAADVPHLARAEVAPARLREPVPRADLAARRAARGGGRRRSLRYLRRAGRASGSTSSSSRPTPPGRCTPAAGAGSPWATRSRTSWRAQGAEVHREYYLNDTGNQLATFRDSLYARYRGDEPPEDGYQGAVPRRPRPRPARRARRRRLARRRRASGACGASSKVSRTISRASACTSTRGSRSARCTSATKWPTCSRVLDEQGVVYDNDGARWLRTTDFGDSRDRVLVRSDGSTTYLCNDLAYHRDKLARGSDHLIDMWGADHHGQVKSTQAGMQALGFGPPPEPEVLLGQMVKLVRDGVEVKLSKRAGTIVTLADILDEVDPDVAAHDLPPAEHRLAADLRPRRRDVAVDGEPRLLRAVRARARCRRSRAAPRRPASRVGRSSRSTCRRSRTNAKPSSCARSRCTPTSSPTRRETRAPQKISTWVRDFARAFHGFYRDCRVITDDAELTQARLLARGSLPDRSRQRARPARCGRTRRDGPPRRADDEADLLDEPLDAVVADAAFDLTLLPASAPDRADGGVSIGGVDLVDLAARYGTPLVRVRRRRAPRRAAASTASTSDGVAYASKAFLCTAMARLVADEGLDHRRGDRWRAARRAARRLPAGTHRDARQQQVDRRARGRDRRRRRPDHRRLLRRARPARVDRGVGCVATGGCWCASRPASRRTRTSSSRPAPKTRSSASACRTATRWRP